MHFYFHYRFFCLHIHVLLVTATMLSFVISSVFANEESTRNAQNTNQAAAFNYSGKNHNNNIDVDSDIGPLNNDKTFSKHIIQEVMPNYKKLKKDANAMNTNAYTNSFHETKQNAKTKNAYTNNSKPSSIFFIYNPSNKLNENLLHKSSLSPSMYDNPYSEHNVVDVTAAESLGHQENIFEVDNINMQSAQIKTDKSENNNNNSFPNINEVPTVTVTELPVEFLQSSLPLDSTLLNNQKNKIKQYKETIENLSIDIVENITEKITKENEGEKFNDPVDAQVTINYNPDSEEIVVNDTVNNIPIDINQTNVTTKQKEDPLSPHIFSNQEAETLTITKQLDNTIDQLNTTTSSVLDKQQINLTSEEIPIPVFSEWAQKQMEAAEKQAALEQQEQTSNHSTQRKNHTKNGHAKKVSALKVRLKNYASPDCGAKIIASNSEAKNTGAILSSSRDEYMLSPCGNRIWFIVELCEAIQAQRVDLANFELFSSSPKNFTVAVANRLPTRDWSNVGRFIAEDRRTVQSFELHPHLFGKYVRIDIHSHYAKEHFCPVSLFRVFGTSEFEAFETENLPNQNLEDFDDDDEDEIIEEQEGRMKPNESNIFKSASDAVLSIVKKAAEVLGKPEQIENRISFKSLQQQQQQQTVICQTPIKGYFNCTDCNQKLIERINSLISCESHQLINLLHISRLKDDLLTTHICDKSCGVAIEMRNMSFSKVRDIRKSYYINILPIEYIGALCQLMMNTERVHLKKLRKNISVSPNSSKRSCQHQQKVKKKHKTESMPANVTLEKKIKSDADGISILSKRRKKITQSLPEMIELEKLSNNSPQQNDRLRVKTTTSSSIEEFMQLPKPHIESNTVVNDLDNPTTMATTSTLINDISDISTTSAPVSYSTSEVKSQIADINIFNVPDNVADQHLNIKTESSSSEDKYNNMESLNNADNVSTNYVPNVINTYNGADAGASPSEDTNSWENIENLLNTSDSVNTNIKTVQDVPTTGYVHNGNILQQQKIPGGPYTESVFLRLSNRIKTLELNMSLSGQYLEELSRRYKKQVEELQQTLSQQTLTVRMLEERNRRHVELEHLYASHTAELKKELNDLTLQVHACIVVIIFVGTFIFLALVVGALFYRSMRRDTKEILSQYNSNINDSKKKQKSFVNNMTAQTTNIKKANRRKSCEDVPNHHSQEISTSIYELDEHKHNRNSHNLIEVSNNVTPALTKGKNMLRQRKMSICYSNQSHVNYLSGISGIGVENAKFEAEYSTTKPNTKRKSAKHSWPNTAHSRMQAGHRFKELHLEAEKMTDKNDTVSIETMEKQSLVCGLTDSNHNIRRNKKKKENKQQSDKTRQIFTKLYDEEIQTVECDGSLKQNTHGLDNILLTTGFKDNEFMLENSKNFRHTPSPPSQAISEFNYNENSIGQWNSNDISAGGDHCKTHNSDKLVKNVMMMNNNNNSIKSRLPSPAFFKAPFKRSLKCKTTKKNTPHESTSWEWHRLKKTVPTALTTTVTTTSASTAITTTHSLLPSVTKSSYLSPLPSTIEHNNNVNLSPLSSEINFLVKHSSKKPPNYCQILENAVTSSATNMHHHNHAIQKHLLLTDNVEMDNLIDTNHINNSHLVTDNSFYINSRSGGSSSSTSNSSNCSSNQSTKKKNNHCNRTFNKIFRKVF